MARRPASSRGMRGSRESIHTEFILSPEAARSGEAGPQQPARASQRRRLRGYVGPDVRQGTRLLFHARPRRSQLGQTRDAIKWVLELVDADVTPRAAR